AVIGQGDQARGLQLGQDIPDPLGPQAGSPPSYSPDLRCAITRGQGRARRQSANTASAPSTISQATRPPSQPSTAEAITRIASKTTARTGDGLRIFALGTGGLIDKK